MRVLFLDFDGVLNSASFFLKRGHEAADCEGKDWSLAQLDAECVKRLDRVVEKTDCRIVISSTWRLGDTLADLHGFLVAKGLRDDGRVIGKTPNGFNDPELRDFGGRLLRATEIGSWLKTNGKGYDVERFAIVDDDYDAGVGYAPQFVQTDVGVGLTDADAERLVAILLRDED